MSHLGIRLASVMCKQEELFEIFKFGSSHDCERFNMIYHSTQYDHSFWYLILRRKQSEKFFQKIASSCSSRTIDRQNLQPKGLPAKV